MSKQDWCCLFIPERLCSAEEKTKWLFKSSFFIFPVLDRALIHLLPGCLGCWAPWQLPPSKLLPEMGWGVWDGFGSTQTVVPRQLVAKEPCSPTKLKQNKWRRMVLSGPRSYRHVSTRHPQDPHLLLRIKERGGKKKNKKKDNDWQPRGGWGGGGEGEFLQDFLSLADFLLARQPLEPWCLPLDGAQPSPRSPADLKAFLDVNIYKN